MTSPRSGFTLQVVPAILYCLLIFTLSSISQPPAPDYGLDWGDKINHAVAYAVMAILAFRAARWLYPARSRRWWIATAVLFSSIYGVSDEFHQYFVPGRSCDLWDLAADAAGALFSGLVLMINGRRDQPGCSNARSNDSGKQ